MIRQNRCLGYAASAPTDGCSTASLRSCATPDAVAVASSAKRWSARGPASILSLLAAHDASHTRGARNSSFCPSAEPRCEQLALLGKPTQRVMAERDQRSPIGARKIVADHDCGVEGFRLRFEPADQIYCRPDYRKIESLGGANIPVDDRTDVQR